MRRTPRSHVLRRAAVATTAVLALGGLSACNDDAPAPVTDSSSASTEPSDAPEAGADIDPATFIDDVLAQMTDMTTAHLTMTMTGGPVGMSMEGDVDYTTSPPNMAMTMSNAMFGDGDAEVVMVDGVMYMQMAQMSQLGEGKWIKMDLGGDDSPLGDDLLEQMDPSASLEMMQDSVTDVTFVGEEDVDGESLRHYEMTMRSEAVRDLQEDLGAEGQQLPEVITYDLWIDDEGRMRQTETAMGDLGSVSMTVSGWGDPVDITAPPAADVIEMPNGMPGAGSA
ncbi:MAG: DUF6612 family protein [Nocardioides sp.]